MTESLQTFDINDIKTLTENILKDNGKYYSPIIEEDLKDYMLSMFEKGDIPGYLLSPKYVCDENGPKVTLEFIPENSLAILDLIKKPSKKNEAIVKCTIHKPYKDFLKSICKKAKCSQDMMIRSILIKTLDIIHDQLK